MSMEEEEEEEGSRWGEKGRRDWGEESRPEGLAESRKRKERQVGVLRTRALYL